jgi:transcriptional regulator with XRE-family HTH domain
VIPVNIKSEQQYKTMKKRIESLAKQREDKRRELEAEGLKEEHIQIALLCVDEIYHSTKRDVEEYERVMTGDFEKETVPLHHLGSHLIKLRLWKGLNQIELAERLGVSQEQVSKDENRGYQGASMDKIHRVLRALGVEKLTILTSEKYPTPYEEWLKKQKALQEISASQDETSATKQAG